MHKLVECVPNFSEGRDLKRVDRIVEVFRNRRGVKLLDYTSDIDHNRMVVTAIGDPEAMKEVIIEAIGEAVALIDLNEHDGEHPFVGAADVVPFIPVRGMTMDEAVRLSQEVAEAVAERYRLPVYLYEQSAGAPYRQNLADVRRGGYRGLTDKMQDPDWQPDYGVPVPHPTAGAVVIGARQFLIAYNINLDTDDLSIARAIARRVRFKDGGLPYCKALGLMLKEKSCVQVSMNLTDYTQTGIYEVFELVKTEAARQGVGVKESELIGLMPLAALTDLGARYLQLPDLTPDRILEYHFE